MVVPFSAGGTVDPSARLLADALSKLLGQAFVVEDRPGASGNIAYGDIARAPKDGYRALISYSATTACSPELFADLSWDPRRDFTPVAMLSGLTVDDLGHSVLAGQHAGRVDLVSQTAPGRGCLRFVRRWFDRAHRHRKVSHGHRHEDGPRALQGFGRPDARPAERAHPVQPDGRRVSSRSARTGKLKALAVASLSRDPVMPEVPTATEAGVPGFVSEGWMGVFVPSGTPAQVVANLVRRDQACDRHPRFPAARRNRGRRRCLARASGDCRAGGEGHRGMLRDH